MLAAVGSAGYGASLLQHQALGVEGSARMTAQGLGAVLAGALADVVGAGVGITVFALASLAVTATRAPALARAELAARPTLAV